MAFTLADYDARLIDRISTVAGDTRLTSAVRYRTINDALAQICLERDWPWLLTSATITTVAGTSTSNLPTRHIRTDSITETATGISLSRRSLIELDQVIYRGPPRLYHVDAGVITFKPIPDGVYSLTHRYRQSEAALALTTDAPLIPDLYSRGVVEYSALLCLRQIKEMERAVEAEKDYGTWLRRVQDNVNLSREPIRVRVRPGAWL